MLDWSGHLKIRRAAALLASGGVIAYPTEAVWGLGCAPGNKVAVDRLLALKQRDVGKGMILVAANVDQLSPYLQGLSAAQRKTLEKSWPGPVTWLVPDNGSAPPWIRGNHDSLALRVSNHPVVIGLCRAFNGAIVSTSANPQGRPPARSALRVRHYFHDQLDFITPGSVGKGARPSEIRDLITGAVKRPG